MLTPLGKALRRLRIERGWLLKDMAEGIDVAPSFLSAVEMGRKTPPPTMIDRIVEWGKLTNEEEDELAKAYVRNATEVRISLPENMPVEQREAAAILARQFGSLPAADIDAIRNLLNRRKA